MFQLQATGLDLRDIEDVVDDAEQQASRDVDLAHIFVLTRIKPAFHGQTGHADDGIHRRADFVTHRRQKTTLGLIGQVSFLSRLDQFARAFCHQCFEMLPIASNFLFRQAAFGDIGNDPGPRAIRLIDVVGAPGECGGKGTAILATQAQFARIAIAVREKHARLQANTVVGRIRVKEHAGGLPCQGAAFVSEQRFEAAVAGNNDALMRHQNADQCIVEHRILFSEQRAGFLFGKPTADNCIAETQHRCGQAADLILALQTRQANLRVAVFKTVERRQHIIEGAADMAKYEVDDETKHETKQHGQDCRVDDQRPQFIFERCTRVSERNPSELDGSLVIPVDNPACRSKYLGRIEPWRTGRSHLNAVQISDADADHIGVGAYGIDRAGNGQVVEIVQRPG